MNVAKFKLAAGISSHYIKINSFIPGHIQEGYYELELFQAYGIYTRSYLYLFNQTTGILLVLICIELAHRGPKHSGFIAYVYTITPKVFSVCLVLNTLEDS